MQTNKQAFKRFAEFDIWVRLHPDLKERVRRAAQQRGLSVSSFARMVIVKAIGNEQAPTER